MPWNTGVYVFHLFAVIFAGCVANSPRPTLRLIFGRHADEASDERIGVLRGLAFVVCAGAFIDLIVHLLQPA